MTNTHRLTLFIAIAAAAVALIYNAVSIVQGDRGLIGWTPGDIDQRFIAAVELGPSVDRTPRSR